MFTDRSDAGRRLAAEVQALAPDHPAVFALPRGGVPVAIEIASALKAPLDLVVVRKIGAPGAPELALGAIVEGTPPLVVVNELIRKYTGAKNRYLEREGAVQLAELERRRQRYLGRRRRVDPTGKTAILVDDGLATGATMKAAIQALRQRGAKQLIVAIPVAAPDALAEVAELVDQVICLSQPREFRGVGAFFRDFHQLDDGETLALLQGAWAADAPPARQVSIPPLGLIGDLTVPIDARGIVLFAHGSGSSRLSPRNRAVAAALNECGFATVLFDLLTPAEACDRLNVFDISLLAKRLQAAADWLKTDPVLAELPLGLFGASTGAAAALTAAAALGDRVAAVVSRGGRPDLAQDLAKVAVPTLLIVGGNDVAVLRLNRQAHAALHCAKRLAIIPGATHLFEEKNALDAVIDLAADWFGQAFSGQTCASDSQTATPQKAMPGANQASGATDHGQRNRNTPATLIPQDHSRQVRAGKRGQTSPTPPSR